MTSHRHICRSVSPPKPGWPEERTEARQARQWQCAAESMQRTRSEFMTERVARALAVVIIAVVVSVTMRKIRDMH